jgi:hypothetical protein
LERTERWETLEENPQRLAREAGLGSSLKSEDCDIPLYTLI